MRHIKVTTILAAVLLAAAASAQPAQTETVQNGGVQLGPRPFFLVDDMDEGELKTTLQECAQSSDPFVKTDFSIGHRGAPLQFPEHTAESYRAAARMGAGIVECDATFTKDRKLVCRHAQCDLHTTTNILAIPELAAKCSEGFTPARFDPQTGELLEPATAKCCTSDLTLAEFKRLRGKMDAFDPEATTAEEYMLGTPPYRTDLYATNGTLLTHAESIALFQELGVKMTPELKEAEVEMPFGGDYTQADYAQQLIDEYKAAGVPPENVWPQSFNLQDVRYWIRNEPAFGEQAVFLDGRDSDESFDNTDPSTWKPSMAALAEEGVNIIAPPLWMPLTLSQQGEIVPSPYARRAREAGLEMIAWSLERSGPLNEGGGYYYGSIADAINNDGDMLEVVDVLAREIGVLGIFSDWPATTTFYANCMNMIGELAATLRR